MMESDGATHICSTAPSECCVNSVTLLVTEPEVQCVGGFFDLRGRIRIEIRRLVSWLVVAELLRT